MLALLVGNQNSGKTTLFNRLSKSNQKVGNFPGVTVEAKSINIDNDITLIDLPGTYSLNDFSSDELITLDTIKSSKPDLLINVIDVNVLKRSLSLTLELLALHIPMVIVLNMMDEFEASNNAIDIKRMSKALGCKVILMSANKNRNVDQLLSYIKSYKKGEIVSSTFNNVDDTKKRYEVIDELITSFYLKPLNKSIKLEKSLKIDRILLNKYLAYPLFCLMMVFIFFITFGPFGGFINKGVSGVLDIAFLSFKEALIRCKANEFMVSLFIDGICLGLGTLISFLPSIMLLFFLLSLLEDSGYLTRIALIMDKPLRRFNLSGKAFVPFLLGFGCSVPAVLASKTLVSNSEKQRVIKSIPFMPCSAKVPIFMMIGTMFFKDSAYVVCIILYSLGIILSLVYLSFSKKKEKVSEFILEIPPYRMPSISNCLILMSNKCKDFFKKTFSLIFICSLIIWLLTHFNIHLHLIKDINDSLLSDFSRFISFVFIPLGFSDWRIVASIIGGISAKETFVSTMGALFKEGELLALLSPLTAFSLLVFLLLYTPCFASLITISKEMNSKRKAVLIGLSYFLLAYFISFLAYRIGLLFI